MRENIVVIGAVALGPKAACRCKRLNPEARVILLDRGARISYGGCGIPYYVSGDVSDADELQSTSFHMLRDAAFFRDTKDVEARPRTEALSIDRAAKTVRVKNLDTDSEELLPYDKLVLATGSTPRSLPIPGAELPGVFAVADLDAAVNIRAGLTAGQVGSAVVVGAGFIGLEMAVALADMWGIETTVVEYAPLALPTVLSPTLASMVQRHMEEKGVQFRLAAQVTAIEGDGKAERVRVKTAQGEEILDADLVIMAVGVTPNTGLAKAAGLSVSPRGGIVIDEEMRTSDPDIFAGGDCAEIKNLVTGQDFFLPLGSLANRQGRVIGDNLCGLHSRFPGAAGAWCVKLFDQNAAGVGLTLEAARRAGLDAVSVHVSQFDRAHFYPDKDFMFLELVAERGTRRVLGVQGVSAMGDALVGRIGAVSALMPHKPTTTDLALMELPYSPPFNSAMDILNMLGNVGENILTGRNSSVDPLEFAALFDDRANPELFFLDCRELGNAAPFLAKYPGVWNHIPQGQLAGRLGEVPRDRKVVLLCNSGARSYEAFLTLAYAGFTNVVNVAGGMASLHTAGVDPKV
ncbi:MAG: FAD-dependent oxidoreductase [Humidesulfovibrio sp.]|uniref:FAD-dependent oxidoreductase n=1 Tax=Humidesulfovibrio sp. TaxID=2910988 RepID=UPI002736888D|nr:FAD-dependent oxidoreductase [Humidesulfovibrio sp.]MDP2847171.1 FAD-dependent oxidoreductase [Humidesulfovibrio sp.]